MNIDFDVEEAIRRWSDGQEGRMGRLDGFK
jgi:hypothetical protein